MTARSAAAIVAALTVLAALLRVPGLNAGMWFDEIVTLVESVRQPLSEIVTAFPGYNDHPFYSLLAHVSVAGLGEHAWTVRLPALVFGVAGIPVLYQLGAAVMSRSEGVMAALLLTVSYHHVWFSQNARGYTVLLFFTLLATLLFVRLLQGSRPRTAVAYGIVVGLGTYTHLTMAFVVVAHVIIWGWQFRREPVAVERSRHLRTASLALGVGGVVAGLLYLPMAEQLYAVLSGPRPATAAVATPRWAVLETLRGLRVGFGTVGLLGALALVALGVLGYLRKNPIAAFLLLLPGAISVGVMLVAGMSIRPRFFFSFLGFGLLMLVRGAIDGGSVLQRWTRSDDRRFRFGICIL
jgi:mannosyltransferase